MQQITRVRTVKHGNEIKAGDALYHAIDGGSLGAVQRVRPYTGPLLHILGAGTQIGTFYGGKEMTLPAVSVYEVR
jgi:hypothetical protein